MRFAVGHADQHEPATPDIAGGRMNHRQRKPRGDRCVDGIASGLQDFHTNLRRELMNSHNHRMLGTDWVSGRRADRNGDQQQSCC
jgi:hypothetical protein